MKHSDFVPATRPVLRDVESCEDWLARAPLADSGQACTALLALLGELEDAPPRHATYLQILERLREPILVAQEENAKKFTSKPLPLNYVEAVAFSQVCGLWKALLRAYGRLRNAAIKRRATLEGSIALLCERTIACTGGLIDSHFLARREVGEDLWHRLHEAYALAERQGIVDVPVYESSSPKSKSSTCTAAYARPLMLALLHPCALKERELAWAKQWTQAWATKVRVGPPPRTDSGFCVDLTGSTSLRWGEGQARRAAMSDGPPVLRHLDFRNVGRSIKWRLKQLEDGALPAELGLGRSCPPADAGELLALLHGCWTRPPTSRQFPRHPAQAPAEVATGLAQIHSALGGEVIVANIRHWDFNLRDVEQIHNIRHAAELEARRNRLGVEQWRTLDESAGGFRLCREGPGGRLVHRQLIALRPQGASRFILCEVRWLAESTDQALSVGTRALIGIPQPASVRPVGEDSTAPFSYAITIPGPGHLPASVVLPGGWYQPGRTLELRDAGQTAYIRLIELLERGHDFDHARFQPVVG